MQILDAQMLNLLRFNYGEFDSGSERTLAAWIRHASRTGSHSFKFSDKKLWWRVAKG